MNCRLVERSHAKPGHREVCWRELHLQLLDKGVFVARKFFLNASLEEEDYAQLVEALEVGLDRLHEDGLV